MNVKDCNAGMEERIEEIHSEVKGLWETSIDTTLEGRDGIKEIRAQSLMPECDIVSSVTFANTVIA